MLPKRNSEIVDSWVAHREHLMEQRDGTKQRYLNLKGNPSTHPTYPLHNPAVLREQARFHTLPSCVVYANCLLVCVKSRNLDEYPADAALLLPDELQYSPISLASF
jgi:hypothetical protein